MTAFFKLARPRQYVKNLFIFLPVYFGLQITDLGRLLDVSTAFIAFSLVASSVYILNDLMDIEEDRKHPVKRERPLASGAVSRKNALIFLALLLGSGLGTAALVNFTVLKLILFYHVMNVLYSLKLKHVPIIDIVTIALGFVLRVLVGIYSSELPMSMWIVVMTFLLALFLALAKRRDDVLIRLNGGPTVRRVIDGYNLKFIDGAMMIMASVVLVAYILYTVSPEIVTKFESEMVYISAVFVVIGILRYMQITFVEENSGSPTDVLLRDRFLQFTILGWIGVFGWILYL